MPSQKSKMKVTTLKAAPLLQVDWDDAATPDPMEWKEIARDAVDGLTMVRTVGYLAYQDRKMVVLMQSVTDDGGCGGEWAIPRGCITKIRRLR